MGKALLTFEEFRTMSYEIKRTLNSRRLTYVDEDSDNTFLTPNHLIYGRNINEKRFNDSSSERHIYDRKRYSNYDNDLVNDVVLIKEDITPRIKWRKAKAVNVIRGRDNLIRGVELKVFQPKLNRTVTINRSLQLVIPFEINKTVENVSIRPRRVAAANADIKPKLTTDIIW